VFFLTGIFLFLSTFPISSCLTRRITGGLAVFPFVFAEDAKFDDPQQFAFFDGREPTFSASGKRAASIGGGRRRSDSENQ